MITGTYFLFVITAEEFDRNIVDEREGLGRLEEDSDESAVVAANVVAVNIVAVATALASPAAVVAAAAAVGRLGQFLLWSDNTLNQHCQEPPDHVQPPPQTSPPPPWRSH